MNGLRAPGFGLRGLAEAPGSGLQAAGSDGLQDARGFVLSGGAAWLLVVLVTLGGASVARGQEAEPRRPYRGLFEDVDAVPSAAPVPAPPRTLAFTLNVFSQFDDSGRAGSRATTASPAPAGNHYSAVDVALARRYAGRRFSYNVGAASQVRHYLDQRSLRVDQQSVVVDFESRPTRTKRFTFSNRATYAPSYSLSVPLAAGPQDPGDSPAPGLDTVPLRTTNLSSTLAASQQIGRATTLDASYGVVRVAFLDRGSSMSTHRLSAGVARAKSHAALRLRYDFTHQREGGASRVNTHEFDVNVRLAPPPWKTSLVFGLTPSLTLREAPPWSLPVEPRTAGTGSAVNVGALVGVERRLSHAWRVGVGYQRALYSDNGYRRPSFVQTGSGRVDGALSRRMSVIATVAYSDGAPSLAVSAPPRGSYSVSGRWSLQATRSTLVFVDYQRFGYTAVDRAAAGPANSSALDRRSLRIGMTLTPRAR